MNTIATSDSLARGQAQPTTRARKTQLSDYAGLIRFASLAVTLAVWEWYGRGVDPIFFSYPTAILAAVPAMIEKGELQKHGRISMQGFIVGFAVAIFSALWSGS